MRTLICWILTLSFCKAGVFCQDTIPGGKNTPKQKRIIKKGWNFGALPTLAYDSDMGFMYGALASMYNYGDGSRYPMYDHYLFILASKYTKGTGMVIFQYDSDRLIKGFRTLLDLRYVPEPKMDFFGFNGYESVYNASWIDPEDTGSYHTRVFYSFKQKKIKGKLDLRHRIGDSHFHWLAGGSVYRYYTGPVDIDKLNRRKDSADLLPDVPGLFDHYVDWGVIAPGENDGGWVTYLKAGIMYDSRDNEPNPMRGMWTELSLEYAPGFLGNGSYDHLLLTFIHRQYFTLIRERLSFVYRLSYQGSVAGKVPFYAYPAYALGGAFTLRGVRRMRVAGPAVAYGNAEIRWKSWYFHIKRQNFYLALSGFCDAGMVVRKRAIDRSKVVPGPGESVSDYFSGRKESPHIGAGGGLHIAMNENFIVACVYARALDRQDGISGLYIGLDFLF